MYFGGEPDASFDPREASRVANPVEPDYGFEPDEELLAGVVAAAAESDSSRIAPLKSAPAALTLQQSSGREMSMRTPPRQPSSVLTSTASGRGRTPKERESSRGWWLSFLWVICLFGLGGWCFLPSSSPPAASTAAVSPAAHEYITKPIGEIRQGDIVLARDEFGNDIGLKRVVEVYRRTSDHLRILTFAASDGSEQTLKTTDDHPFWVVSRDAFVDAKRLQPGDQFASPHGPRQRLIRSVYEPHPEGVPVYNFQVEDYHTYFVGDGSAVRPLPILVHNSDCGPAPPAKSLKGRKHGGTAHDNAINTRIADIPKDAVDVRKHQSQVSAKNRKVSDFKPDAQWTEPETGVRHYYEASSRTSKADPARLRQHDPAAVIEVFNLDTGKTVIYRPGDPIP